MLLAAFGIITCNQEAPFTGLYYSEKKVANISLSIAFLFLIKIIILLGIAQLVELNNSLFNISNIAQMALVGFPFTIMGSMVFKCIPELKKEKIIKIIIKTIVVFTLLSLLIKIV